MHRHGAAASVFLVCLSRILFVQLCRCDSFTPRGGGQRDRERFANLSLSLQHLSTHSGRSLRRDITANRVVYTNIVCAIQVRSLIATSTWCAAVCVRAGIVRVSVGMSGLCRLFFICADGKKTALVRAVRTFLIAADRENGNNFVKLKSVSSR